MNWPMVRLDDICRIELGKTPSRGDATLWDKDRSGSNIWLSIADLPFNLKPVMIDSKEYISEKGARLCKVIPAGTLIVSFKLSIGRLAYTGTDLFSNEAIAALYVEKDIDIAKDYLYWALTNFDWDKAVGSDVKVKGKTLNKAKLKELLIPLPPISEQQRIVAILDQAFADIEKARANAEQNLKNARELFDSYLQQVFSQRGEGWFETVVGEQLTLQRGFDITKKQQRPGKIPVVSSGGIKSHHDTHMAAGPGVVIGRKGSLGTVFFLEDDYWPHDTTLWVKDFKGNAPRLVYYYFLSLDVKHLDSGAANPALNRNLVHPISTMWPSKAKQGETLNYLDKLSEKLPRLEEVYRRKIDSLDELKKSLLQKAFSGELTKSRGMAA
jgi:type I restriction enzyme, S subunit